MIFIYTLAFIVFINPIINRDNISLESKNIPIIANSILLILFTTIFHNIFEDLVDKNNVLLYVAIACYDLVCCIFTLSIQYGILQSEKLEQDTRLLEHILHMQKDQLEISKNNMEIMNIKYHDLKYHLSSMKDKISDHEIDQLIKSVTIYEKFIKTGNEALDVLLSEKNMICKRNDIKLNCMVDGKKLDFMQPAEIYSLFGNAIDNAIEAALKITTTEKRAINVSVKCNMKMVSISIENYYSGELKFIDEIPITTKIDKNFHGYGIKSIKMLVDKYDGYLKISADNYKFNLSILFQR